MAQGTGAGSSPQRMITAFFDSRTDAEEAVTRLTQEGISQSGIRLVPSAEQDSSGAASVGEASESLWESLRDLFLPDEDRHTYAEGLRRGGYLVTVNVTDAQYDRALDILDDEGTIDIEERSQSWRSEGWTGYSGGAGGNRDAGRTSITGGSGGVGAAASSATGASMDAGLSRPSGTSGMTTAGLSGAGGTTHSTGDRGEEVIPIVEEELHVGKRDVSHGRVRVRSYVVERPVQEQVSLREENVHVERRAASGTASTVTGDPFQERTIELDEKREEAVVSKEARVKEELVVRKDVEQRTETVSDTVRRTEVDVEDDRKARDTGNPGTTDRKR